MKIRARRRRKRPTRRAQTARYERDDGPLSAAVLRVLIAESTGRLPTGPVLRSQSLFGAVDDDAP